MGKNLCVYLLPLAFAGCYSGNKKYVNGVRASSSAPVASEQAYTASRSFENDLDPEIFNIRNSPRYHRFMLIAGRAEGDEEVEQPAASKAQKEQYRPELSDEPMPFF